MEASRNARNDNARLLADQPIEPGAAGRFQSPLYHQILLILKQRIAEGEWAPGDLVPGEQELAELYGVSRVTAKRALDELAAAGLVVRERGRGTRVLPSAVTLPVSTDAAGPMDPLIAMGGSTTVRLLECRMQLADIRVCHALDLEPGDEVLRAVRVRACEAGPFSHLTTYVPDWAAGFDPGELDGTALLALLERQGFRPSSAEQEVSVTLADPTIADRLDVDVGAPLLRKRRVVRDQERRPIELLLGLYRCDRYRLAMTLDRDPAAGPDDWSTQSVAVGPSMAADIWRPERERSDDGDG